MLKVSNKNIKIQFDINKLKNYHHACTNIQQNCTKIKHICCVQIHSDFNFFGYETKLFKINGKYTK